MLDYAVVGVRRDESRARSERYKEPEVCRVYNKTKGIKSRQYLPILDWTKEDVAEFLTERGVKCHALYYDEHGKRLNDNFKRSLELTTEEGKLNYVAYLLADENGNSIKVAK